MQNRAFLVLLRPIFGEKMKTALLKESGCRSCEEHVVIRPEKVFEYPLPTEKSVSISVKTFFSFFFLEITWFWAAKRFEFPILAEKSVSISVKTFFFWRSPVFGLKKGLNFRVFRETPSQFLDKPCDSDSRTMKIRVKVVCSFLTLSKKPPPPPPFSNPGYAPADVTILRTDIKAKFYGTAPPTFSTNKKFKSQHAEGKVMCIILICDALGIIVLEISVLYSRENIVTSERYI